jgi:CO/xanthine dehydrogenase FAD-binding subunit
MKPVAFDYAVPDTLDAAIAALRQAGEDGRLLAGGQSLMPMLNFRVARPSVLIDLNRIPELALVRRDGDQIVIGAMTRQAVLLASDDLALSCPLLRLALSHVGHPQTRARGTIGGSLCHADPAAELPVVAVLLNATLRVRGPDGARDIAARDFFLGSLTTALAQGEILTEIVLPVAGPGEGFGFVETSLRKGDFAIASAAARIGAGSAELVVGGVADAPFLAALEPAALVEAERREAAIRAALDSLDVTQNSHHASAAYRRTLSLVMARRAVEAALNGSSP